MSNKHNHRFCHAKDCVVGIMEKYHFDPCNAHKGADSWFEAMIKEIRASDSIMSIEASVSAQEYADMMIVRRKYAKLEHEQNTRH